MSYLPFGPIAGYTLGNSQTVARSYDANYRLTDLTSAALNLHVARDAMGEITALGNTPGASPATETYSYDPLYRLTVVAPPGGPALESYAYNKTGDRLSKIGGILASGTYSYTSGTHWLSSIGSAARANDATGNTTGSVTGGETFGFGYSDRNRMVSVVRNGSPVASYVFNALGQRIGKAATFPSTVSQRYGYDESSHLLNEYGTGNRDYLWLDDLPIAVVDLTTSGSVTTSTINYVHADGLGTPRAVTDSTGAMIWQWAYQGNPFGEKAPTSSIGYVFNLRHPGQYYDTESGLAYNVNRDYEVATGRYLQSDPIGLNGGINTFAYASNNPLSYTDLLGLCDQDRCKKVKEDAIELCSNSSLPSGDNGYRFWNCVNAYMETNGCGPGGGTPSPEPNPKPAVPPTPQTAAAALLAALLAVAAAVYLAVP